MTEDIRKAAQTLINVMEASEWATPLSRIKECWSEYQDLKAALRPSREEVAAELEGMISDTWLGDYSQGEKTITQAIQYLREES